MTTSPSRQRAADRFRSVGVGDEAADALAALAHPFDGPATAPPAQVRSSIQAEADAFRTASAGVDDAETLLWLGTTVADRYVTTAASAGSADLAGEFRTVRDAMDRGIAEVRRGPLMPPVGPVRSDGDDGGQRLAWPSAGAADPRGAPPPPPAEAATLPPPAWPGQTVEQQAAPGQDRRSWVVALLVGVPLLLLVVGAAVFLPASSTTGGDAEDAVVDVPEVEEDAEPESGQGEPGDDEPGDDQPGDDQPGDEVPDEPVVPPLPDLERPAQDVFLEVLGPIAQSEETMVGWSEQVAVAVQDGLEGEELDDAVTEAAEEAIEGLRETQAEIDDAGLGDRDAEELGDLPQVLDTYREHQEAWIGVWETAIADPATAYDEEQEPVDLFDDVNRTATEFAFPFAAVVPRGLEQDDVETVAIVLSGFGGPFDPAEVFGQGDGPVF